MLNFKDWEKTADDGKTVTMAHPSGHTMKIFVSKLPKIQQEAIKGLKLAKGGKVKNMDEGGPTSPNPTPNDSPDVSASAPVVAPPPPEPPSYPPAPTNAADISGAANINGAASLTPLQQQAQQVIGAQGQEIQGAKQQAQVQADIAKASLPGDLDRLQNEQQRKDLVDASSNQFNQATGQFDKWMALNGKPNPQHFMQSMPDAQKVTTALGLIIGGFGSGLTGRPNPAQVWLDNQQEKDLAAQNQAIESHKTVLGAYKNLFNDNVLAANATRISDNNNQILQAKQIADARGDAQSQANFNAFAGKKIMDNNDIMTKNRGYLESNPIAASKMIQPKTAGGASGSWGGAPVNQTQNSVKSDPDHILGPNAAKQHAQYISQFNPVPSAEQKSLADKQYQDSNTYDQGVEELKTLWPRLESHANAAGYLSEKVDPEAIGHVTGGIGAAGAELATGGGGGGLGAIPVGLGGAAAGEAAGRAGGSLLKQGLRAAGGQEQTEYEADRNALRSIVARMAGSSGQTPTALGELGESYAPTRVDLRNNKEASQYKLKSLLEKTKALVQRGAIKDLKWTNEK